MCFTTTPSTDAIQVDAVNACDVSALRNGSTVDDNISCNDKNDTILDYSNSSDNMTDVCAICFETLQDGDDITTSNCSKTFHRTCIITWLMLHDTCPYCRNTFKNINDTKNIDAMIVNDIFDCEQHHGPHDISTFESVQYDSYDYEFGTSNYLLRDRTNK